MRGAGSVRHAADDEPQDRHKPDFWSAIARGASVLAISIHYKDHREQDDPSGVKYRHG